MTSPATLLFSTRGLPAQQRAPPPAAAAHTQEQQAVANLEGIVARVAASASTRACSLDLVRYARATPEPLARPAPGTRAEKNPWLTEVEGAKRPQACCVLQ